QPKPFCIAVSDAVRAYLEERFEFRAPERTTEEFLHELRKTDLLSEDQKGTLGEFLCSCDLVKFAKYEPNETKLRELYGAAMRLVDETVPAEVQRPTSEVQSQESEVKPAVNPDEPEVNQASKGKTFAITGTLLQLGPLSI